MDVYICLEKNMHSVGIQHIISARYPDIHCRVWPCDSSRELAASIGLRGRLIVDPDMIPLEEHQELFRTLKVKLVKTAFYYSSNIAAQRIYKDLSSIHICDHDELDHFLAALKHLLSNTSGLYISPNIIKQSDKERQHIQALFHGVEKRYLEILPYIHKDSQSISELTGKSVATIYQYRHHLKSRLGLKRNDDLVQLVLKHGLAKDI
ncbi:MAG: hypothetical protein C9356_15765 [Oleiphilus sp.]|nr:MAG: hypothetical protein C9356_15765 [Oleiphilus sp.]